MADVLFDLRGGAEPVFGTPPTLDQSRVHQQHCYEPVTKLIYATQVVANGQTLPGETEPPPTGTRDARGDIAITRLTLAGQKTGVMYCRGFDHGNGIGAEYDADTGTTWLWLSYDAVMEEIGSGVNAHGRRVVRLPFVDGDVVDVGDPGLDVYNPFPGITHIQPLLDAAHGHMGVTYSQGSGTWVAVFELAAFKAKDFSAPLYNFPRPTYANGQSSALYGNYLYMINGTAYSDTNPPPPDGEGNAYLTVIDVRSGTAIDRMLIEYALDLEYREPESVFVWNTDAGPQLVFGFAVDEAPRRMALYAITAQVDTSAPIAAEVRQAPDEGVLITVNVAQTDTIQTWQILREVSGAEQVLFQGSGASLPNVSTWMDEAPPACVPLTYRLLIQRTDGSVTDSQAPPVTFVPDGGCNQGGQAVGEQTNTLGCAAGYTAQLHWRGGAQPYESSAMDRLTEVTWNRTINDVAEASITVLKGDISEGCCQALGQAEPWVHELTLYRDGELCWQGPITRTTSRRDSIVIQAMDVTAWFDHLVNTYRVTYTASKADAAGRKAGPITQIAYNHIRLNLNQGIMAEPDYPRVLDYMIVRNTGLPTIKVEKDGSKNTTIWTAYLGDMLREWAKRGLTWTTVGRSILLRGKPTSTTRAQARLTMNDFTGDIEVIKDGTQGGVYGFATTQESQDISLGKTLGYGKNKTVYGRLDVLVSVDEENVKDADLREAAKDAIAGRYPIPVTISVPDGSALAPTAPVTLRQLVPGERFDVLAENFCQPVLQGFVLTDVEGSWQNGQEKIGVTLTPLADLDEELTS